jgi:hypothetical protein
LQNHRRRGVGSRFPPIRYGPFLAKLRGQYVRPISASFKARWAAVSNAIAGSLPCAGATSAIATRRAETDQKGRAGDATPGRDA